MTAATAYRAVIYLRGTDEKQLNEAEHRCRSYAARFGWHVLESVRDDNQAAPGSLLPKAVSLNAHIILTDTLDMISPDPRIRDDLMMTIERSQRIVHPVTTGARAIVPARPAVDDLPPGPSSRPWT